MVGRAIERFQQRGFTFVEVVVVIIILGIIITVATSGLDGVLDYSRHAEAEEELNNLAEAITGDESLVAGGIRSDFGYVGDVGALPTALANLATNPGGYSTWKGPYVRDNFVENSNDYTTDPWGVTYTYTGGVTIQSIGSGSTITKQIANSSADLTSNSVQGTVLDRNGAPPGADKDSVFVTITYPDGTGSLTSATVNPNSSGYYLLAGIPIGNHSIQAVYTTASDTAVSIASVNPRVGAFVDLLRFGSGYWFDTTSGGGGGGGGTSSSEILRPNGGGDEDDLSSENCGNNWQCIDEVIADNNGTYVKGSGNQWNHDSYALTNSAVGAGTIDSIKVYINCWGSNSSFKAQTVIRTNGNDTFGAQINLTSSYTVYSTNYPSNPETSNAWTWAEVDALEAGVNLKKEARCTQVWVEVFYTN